METKTGHGEKGHMKLVRDLDGRGVEIGWVRRNKPKRSSSDHRSLSGRDFEVALTRPCP
jgi:hypothetical protein